MWGRNIKRRRRALGFSQEKLADLLGVRQATVARWEAGTMEPRRARKSELATALGTDVDMLFPLLPTEVPA